MENPKLPMYSVIAIKTAYDSGDSEGRRMKWKH